MAEAEGREKLVVEIVAVGEDEERRIGEFRRPHGKAGEEGHEIALARALRMPDDADLAVAVGRDAAIASLIAFCAPWNWW